MLRAAARCRLGMSPYATRYVFNSGNELKMYGLPKLTPKQATYINVDNAGPFKADTYRY